MRRLTILTIFCLLATTAWAGAAGPASNDRVSQAIRSHAESNPAGFVDVIITFADRPGKADDKAIKNAGGENIRGYHRLPMKAARIPARAIEALSHNPNVAFISSDAPLQGFAESALVTANLDQGTFENIDYSVVSSGIGVAVFDSGIGNHTDLWPSPVQFDFVGQSTSPGYGLGDPFGHGTHVAGVIGSDSYGAASDFRGVAPYADLLSLRVLNGQGQGLTSDLIAALDWLLVNANQYNIRVANLSLGKAIEEAAADDPLVAAVEAVWDTGIVVVCSAGNYGRDGHFTITSPGNSPRVITVGSITDNETGGDLSDDYVSSYSSKGPTLFDHFVKPDLVAPGNRFVAPISYEAKMRADLPDRMKDCGNSYCSGYYIELSGTSMSAAMVSGTVAKMLEEEPSLNPDTVKAMLMISAKKVDMGNPFSTGA
ncbi:MAG: S8 family peptidase, partial [Acidobacteriota bacterium]|nr:S8 family peptidase [Acidobacteriota bacterium]